MLKLLPKTEQEIQNPYEGRVGLVYARVSSKRQEKEGHGRESQEARCKDYLASIGVSYRKSFIDTKSGGGDFMNREAIREILKYVDANPHKKFVLVFDDLKRFARDTEFHMKLRTTLKARDILPRCLNYNFDDSPEGMFVETVLAAGNELERHQNRRQVIQKMKARLESGHWAFVAKRGYKMIQDPLHGKLAVPKEPEASALKYALEGFSTGIFVRRVDACRYLKEKGFWTQKYIEKYIDEFTAMLKDPFYMGDIEYVQWEVSRRKGHHRGIISAETFELNQRRLKNEISGKRIRVDISKEFPHRGLIVCANCGSHLTAGWTTKNRGVKKKFPYYWCQNRECCLCKKSVPRDDLEKRFNELLLKQKLKKNVDKVAEIVFNRVWKEEISSMVKNDFSLKEQKASLEEKVGKLTKEIINTTSASLKKAYEAQLEQTMKEIDELDSKLDLKIDYSIPYRTALDKATEMLKSPYAVWKKLELDEQQKLFFFIFEEKLWYDRKEGYRTDKIQSYTRLFESFATSKSDDVDLGGIGPPLRQCECRVMPLYYRPMNFFCYLCINC